MSKNRQEEPMAFEDYWRATIDRGRQEAAAAAQAEKASQRTGIKAKRAEDAAGRTRSAAKQRP